MNLPPSEASVTDQQSKGDTRWPGSGLVLARLLWIAIFLLAIVFFYANLIVGDYDPLTTGLLIANTSVWFAVGLVLYRFRWMSTPVQRQQIKWVVFAGAIVVGEVIVGSLIAFVLPASFPAPDISTPFHQLVQSMTAIVPALLPLSIGIALLRYRLWDVDIIINRTLVYGSLTVMLALVYFGLVIGLQSLLHLVTGTISGEPIVIVASTLAIAALFQPLRRPCSQRISHCGWAIPNRRERSAPDDSHAHRAFIGSSSLGQMT